MLRISAAYVVVLSLSVRLSVRPSVTFVYSVETNNYIFYTIRGVPVGVLTGTPSKGGVECKGYEKMAIFDEYLVLSPKLYEIWS